jgi:hypothetical protein
VDTSELDKLWKIFLGMMDSFGGSE